MKPVHYHIGKFPPVDLDWRRIVPHIGPAAVALARFDGMMSTIINPSLLMTPLFKQEAVLSSRIEGTQATLEEVFGFEADARVDLSAEIKEDIQEIQNYSKALNEAEAAMKDLPLCLRVIKDAHHTLMDGVRGQGKAPGEFRRGPNWIGPPGCTIATARYVPVSAERLADAMAVWERFVHGDMDDALVKVGLLHAEFEAIHPFLDGNGRVGRMLIPLSLWTCGLIRRPIFYISAYFEANREQYYERLLRISSEGDWTGWCLFFLQGVRAQAERNIAKANQLIDLYESMKQQFADTTHSQYAVRALDWIFGSPIFKSSHFVLDAAIPKPTAKKMLHSLRAAGVLHVVKPPSGRRSGVFAFSRLLKIVQEDE